MPSRGNIMISSTYSRALITKSSRLIPSLSQYSNQSLISLSCNSVFTKNSVKLEFKVAKGIGSKTTQRTSVLRVEPSALGVVRVERLPLASTWNLSGVGWA